MQRSRPGVLLDLPVLTFRGAPHTQYHAFIIDAQYKMCLRRAISGLHLILIGDTSLQDDLICLPQKVASSFGNAYPLVLCTRVTNVISLTDMLSFRTIQLDVSSLPCCAALQPQKIADENGVLWLESTTLPGR